MPYSIMSAIPHAPKTSAIPRSTTEPHRFATALTAQDLRALLRNKEWIALETRKAQLVFLEEFAQIECGWIFDVAKLANLFKLTRSRVHTLLVEAANRSRAPDRPLALFNKQESELCLIIREKAVAGNYATKREPLNYIEEYFRVHITDGWIRCFL
jgi:hypothetical protein